MKKITYSLFFLTSLIFLNCKKHTTNNLDPNTKIFAIDFNSNTINNKDEAVKSSSLIDSISYVKLETNKESLLGRINKIKIVEDKIYILDQRNSSIAIYDSNGKFLNKINKVGKGPDEYIVIRQFDIGLKNGQIHILDDLGKKMLVYDSSGKLLRLFKIKSFVRDFALLPNGDYLFYTPDYNLGEVRRGLWKVNFNGEFKEQMINIDPDFRYGGIYPEYFKRISKDTIGLIGGEDHNIIYHISDNSIEKAYKFDFNIEIPQYIKGSDHLQKEQLVGKAYTKNSYQETNHYLILNLSDYKDNILFIYDKVKDTIILNSKGVENDIDSIAGFPLNNTVGNSLIFKIPILVINNDEKIQNRFDVSPNENPILQLNHLK